MSSLTQKLTAKTAAEGLNVVSLFDGMSCGMLALVGAGIKVNHYFASEIEKAPITVSKANWGDAITHVGDVTTWHDWRGDDFPTIDLLVGGSPCQSFSMAGKRKGMATKTEEVTSLERYLQLKADGVEFEGQSYLFWEYVQILNHLRSVNPDMYFMLENVNRMARKWEDVISDALGVAPVLINSALVSAQNRERLYWTNISFDRDIKDRGIFLIDILDLDLPSDNIGIAIRDKACTVRSGGRASPFGEGHDWDSPYIKTDKNLNSKTNQDKASCLTGGGNSGGNHSDMDIFIYQYPRGNNKGGILDTGGKCPTLTGSRFENNCKPVIPIAIGAREVGRKIDENGKRADDRPDIATVQRHELRADEKSNCLTTVGKDSLVAVQDETATQYIIRRFTVAECEKLQTVPVGYCSSVAKTHAYKMLGNGWTIEVIIAILLGILNPSTKPHHAPQRPQIQQDMFSEVMA